MVFGIPQPTQTLLFSFSKVNLTGQAAVLEMKTHPQQTT